MLLLRAAETVSGRERGFTDRCSQRMKVFGIGLSRTGTTSLAQALDLLGFRSYHSPASIGLVLDHDALVDTPVAIGYQFLDLMFPGSKFILTDRKEEDWLRSCEIYWSRNLQEQTEFCRKLHTGLYRSVPFSAEKFSEARQRHIAGVKEYFADRPDDLLELRICDGDGWEPLCRFLERPVPAAPFPHQNRS